MSSYTRRTFILTSASALTALSAGRVRGANDRLHLGIIGLGVRGMQLAGPFSRIEGVEVSHLCDPDTARIDAAAKRFPHAKTSQDLRRLIDDPDIDAVVIATCNHWHALATIWACQAKKDVYVEKPLATTLWEGRKMVEAARIHQRIVQGGTQQRSDPFHQELKAFLDTGALGKIAHVRLNRYGLRKSIGKRSTPLTPPTTCDYNLWLGPAQDLPIHREAFHYDWHWAWNTGNGELGNWGAHIIDDARHLAFRDTVSLPRRVVAAGGRLGWRDAGETPNTHFLYMDTGSYPVIMDVHNLPRAKGVDAKDTYRKRGTSAFLVIECEGGYYAGDRGKGSVHDPEGKTIQTFKGDRGITHARNFIEAVRSRNPAHLHADIEQTHFSSAWCHLGNVSWRLGQPYSRQEAEERVRGHAPWRDLVDEFHTHLDANDIDLAAEDIRIGAVLDIDPRQETFTGACATPDALNLLRRTYRPGFEFPDTI